MNNNSHKDLEQFIDRNLRSLPDRKAPRSLEARVMAAIAAREALPWYRQSFAHWPAAARAAFLGSCVLALALLMAAGHSVQLPLANAVSETQGQLSLLGTIFATLRDSCGLLLRSIPPLWIYAALTGIATLYATVFGIGATAYRTLIANR